MKPNSHISSHGLIVYSRGITLLIIIVITALCKISAQSVTDTSKKSGSAMDEQKFINMFDSVKNENRYIERLDSGSFYNLPIGILGSDKDPNYAILIDEVTLYPDKATFNASMVLTNPVDSSKMVFVAKNVAFSFKGGIIGDFRLELESEKPVKLCKDIDLQILSGSYVVADCQGFKSLNIKGRLGLSEKVFRRADAEGNPLPGKVTAYFETNVQSWNDLTFSVSLDPFQLVKYPDFTFQCQNLAVDFSDLKNPSDLIFPKSYQNTYPADMIQLWRGIYIGNATLILNKKFKKENSDKPLIFSAQNLIIDENGFSGTVSVNNLIRKDQGDIGGWKFSIDKFFLQFQTDDLVAGGLDGQIHVPILEDGTDFSYSAVVDAAGNYSFTVAPSNTMSMNLFGKSKLDLYQTSYINIASDSGKFIPSACLNGKLTFNVPVGDKNTDSKSDNDKFKLANVEFQNFRISTVEPKLDIEYMAYNGSNQSKLARFPITIDHVAFTNTPTQVLLSIGAKVNLKKSSEEGFGGNTTITLKADKVGYGFQYKGLDLDEIHIKVSKPHAFTLDGGIVFARGDSIYGNGFRGDIHAIFGEKIKIDVTAIFGNVHDYRYFFVDGLFAKKPGIHAGIITIFGFGGGLYYHMRQAKPGDYASDFGKSSSGILYLPDDKISIGILASVKLGIASEQMINADATFGIAFNSSGGINNISFIGDAQCITKPINIDVGQFKKLAQKVMDTKSDKPSPQGAIYGHMEMYKDFVNDEFHAEMQIYVNVAGAVKGIGTDNLAGWAVIHVTPDEWYIHIGTPTQPVGIKILGLATMQGYFMAGYHMPSTMPVPAKVAEILHINASDVEHQRDESSLIDAKGVAFGASFDVSTGDKTFLMFYANLSLGAGFDIMLADYGKNAYCAGHNPPLGINGWYAKGQAYAYFSGTIGIDVNVFHQDRKFDILSIATAAYLRAEGPNPVWLVGYVGGEYRVLGGMIKGQCNFKLDVGEQCDIRAAQSSATKLQLIGDVTPSDNTNDADVFVTPQVVFNVAVNKTQKLSETDGSSTYFKILLDDLELKQGDEKVPFETRWNYSQDVVQLIPSYVLYPKTTYKIRAKISFEQRVNGTWKPFMEEGVQLTEERTVTFTTGELPDKIPASEIVYSYPINKQYNFMPGEYNKGYLIFRRDLQAFFAPSEDYVKKARWTVNGGSPVETNLNYNSGEKTLYMDLPASMSLSSIYHFELVAIPTAKNSNVDRNVSKSYQNVETGSDTATMEQAHNTAQGTITTTQEKTMFELYFKTSQYNDFDSRFSASAINVRAMYDRGYTEFYLITDLPGGEAFDQFELMGPKGNDPLIAMKAELKNTEWYNDDVYPKNYEQYPWFGHNSIKWRDTTYYGLSASKAITVWQPASFTMLSDAEIAAGKPLTKVSFSDICYMLPYYWSEDYLDIRDRLAYDTRNVTVTNPVIKEILQNIKLRAVKPGDYPIRFSYVLPGKGTVTSTKVITLHSTLKTNASDYE